MIIMIYACDENNAIGKDGDLPWRQSTDLQHFKSITSGGTIVMGRKTWESLPGKLPNRRHVVLTRGFRTDVETATFDEILEMAKSQDLFVIGGGEIYELFLPHTDIIHRTIIHCVVEQPDTFAPEIDNSKFVLDEEKFVEKSPRDQYDMTFQKLSIRHSL